MRPFASVLSARAEKSSTVTPEEKSSGPIGVRAAWLKDVARKYRTRTGRGSYNIHKIRFNSCLVSAHVSWI